MPHRVQLGLYVDETSAACEWHIPEAHFLESWGDTRAADGTASIVQPLISRCTTARRQHEFVAAVLGNPRAERLRWCRAIGSRTRRRGRAATSTRSGKRRCTTASSPARKSAAATPTINNADITEAIAASLAGLAPPRATAPLQLASSRPDPSVWDGRFANNGWLQELPRPFSKLTWDNAALMGPQLAQERGLESGDVVEIETADGSMKCRCS